MNHDKFKELLGRCNIDRKEEIKYPPIALSMGTKTLNTKNGKIELPTPIGTYGNFSFVSAKPKTHKTFFISLLASVYLSGKNRFGSSIIGHRENHSVIHFDTEQGNYHAQKVFKRVVDMSEVANKENYHTLALRTLNYRLRIDFIEQYLKNTENVGLVIVDGIADLCSDVNNIIEANEVVQKMMEWSAIHNCHIISVIHSNWDTDKPTGHLGSFMEKKTETHIQLEHNKNSIKVKCKRSRGFPFESFDFRINEFGFPQVVSDYNPLENFVL